MDYDIIENRKRIGCKIAKIRELRGLSPQELADFANIRGNSVSRIELGKYSLDVDMLGKIVDVLDCKIDIVEKK